MFVGVIHATRFNKKYHFSWLAVGKNSKWDWEGARNYCRKFCMDSITIETPVSSETAPHWRDYNKNTLSGRGQVGEETY